MAGFTSPLLLGKMRRPHVAAQNVPRHALLQRLDDARNVPLTLLSAPAGFGKTLVAAEWADARVPAAGESDQPPAFHAAWLSLDESDNDPLRFWSYVAASLATLPLDALSAPLAELLAQLRSANAPALESVVDTLLAICGEARAHFVLILDDYHHIRAQRIHDTLNYFIAHLPPTTHLLISTRADPPMPLNRWRVNGKLLELRAADLCFSVEEAGAMLSRRTKIVLPPEDVAILVDHTDGWPAGLQLLGASLQGRSRREVSSYLQGIDISNRFVLAYLLEQVLEKLPASVRDFLLRTSILQRFDVSLCDDLLDNAQAGAEVDGGATPRTARAILNYLESYNLFVVPLDDEQRWYRYYHLFADALHEELDRSAPALAAEMHRRAARWYAAHGFAVEAIEHALHAQDWAQAADLLAEKGHDLLVHGDAVTLNRWMETLPHAEIMRRPRLALLNGWLLILRGPLAGVQEVVAQLLSALAAHTVDPAHAPALGEVLALRTLLASYQWDVHKTLELGIEAERTLAADDDFTQAALHHALGHALQLGGRATEAIAHYTRAQAHATNLGSTYMVLFPLFRLGHTYLELGALADAEATYRRGLQLATDHGGGQWPSIADGCMGMAAILRERNDLLGAEHFISRAIALAPARSVSVYASASAINAHIRQSLGRRDEGTGPLADAMRVAQSYDSPLLVEWLRACQARLDLGAGDLVAVRQWAQTQSSHWDEVGYYPEFEELTLARFYLADQRPRAALALLQLWQARAEERGRVRSLVEIGVLQAEALWVLNQRTEAQELLCRALALAEAEGMQRAFLDEGERLMPLLDLLARSDACAARLLATLRAGMVTTDDAELREPLERLTPRELEILRAIARGASNQQVAETFVLTVGTVKGHVNHILSKLGATNRTEAVARAREIGLI